MLIVQLYRGNADIVFIRNYRYYNVSSRLIEHSSPPPRPLHLLLHPLYLSNLFAHHEHHPSEGRLPSSLCAPPSLGFFFLIFSSPLHDWSYNIETGRANLLAPDRRTVIRLCIRIRAYGSLPSTNSEVPSVSRTAPGMRFHSEPSRYSRYEFPSVIRSLPWPWST